jgi:pimeloyl-ACP methyl ester carboxylesterase
MRDRPADPGTRESLRILARAPARARAKRMNLQSRIIKVGKLAAHFLLAGPDPGHQEGVPLLLLHGGGETAQAWRWVMPSLAGRHSVLALDLPGSGRSDLVNGNYTAGFFGRFVRGFLDAVKIDHAVLVGHSLGGLASLQAALDCEDGDRGRVRALALVASAGLGRQVNPILKLLTLPVLGDWSAFWALTPPGQLQRLGLRAWGCFARPEAVPAGWYVDQFCQGLDPGLIWDQLAVSRALIDQQGQREIVLDRLSELSIPTLLLWGESDQILPVSQAEDAIRELRHGRLRILHGCGHMPQVERPALFVEALEQFVGALDDADG